jgi:hypothetical protein
MASFASLTSQIFTRHRITALFWHVVDTLPFTRISRMAIYASLTSPIFTRHRITALFWHVVDALPLTRISRMASFAALEAALEAAYLTRSKECNILGQHAIGM